MILFLTHVWNTRFFLNVFFGGYMQVVRLYKTINVLRETDMIGITVLLYYHTYRMQNRYLLVDNWKLSIKFK